MTQKGENRMDMPGLAAMPDAVMEGDHCAIYPFRNESGPLIPSPPSLGT